MNVTVLIPALNEEHGIGPTIDSVDKAAFKKRGWDLEFLVIDGGSTDRTREEAEARGALIIIEERRGYGRAYKTGLREATGDVIVTADADNTYPLEVAHEFIDLLVASGLDFITCDRYADIQPGAMTWKHRFGNWVLSTTVQGLFFVRLRDSQSGMWVLRRSALDHIPYEELPDGMAFSQEIKIEALKRRSIRAAEVPGRLEPRIGDAKIESWGDGLGNLGALYKRRLRGRSPKN